MLVTGAGGFTGAYFVKMAESEGYEIHSLKSDLLDAQSIQLEILKVKPEVVVHLAAITNVDYADSAALYKVNVVGTTNLLDSLVRLDRPPTKVLLASSANVYGNNLNSPISEDESVAPISHYAMSKVAMEFMARTYLGLLPIFFTRPFNYTGKGQLGSFLIPKLVNHFANRMPLVELGNIDVAREFNDVLFVCAAYLRLIEKAEIGQIYNICSGKPIELVHVIKILTELTDHEIEINVNKALIRKNEIDCLSGSTRKLFNTIGEIQQRSLRDVLAEMLG